MVQLTHIGTVKSNFREKADPFEMRKHESRIVLDRKFTPGLFRLDESDYIQVIFGFHLSGGYSLKGPVYTGETKGVFASRSPNRPSPLGVTTVKLLKIEGEVLSVSGLDAVDGSPVYDIKPYAKVFDEIDGEKTGRDWCLTNPRSPMAVLIGSNDLAGCLSEAGKLHGHFCPGLSLGVYAAVTGMKRIASSIADGMEGLCAVIEVNSCFADGIQAVTGCTFGNNSLIYRDIGKTAVTLAHRGKPEGLRIMVKPAFREILQKDFPVYSLLFDRVVRERGGDEKDMADFKEKGREASFGILSYPSDSLFIVREVPVTLPPYAPMVNSLRCDRCGEEVMETKTVKKDGLLLCRSCGGGYPCLTGAGIVCHCG